MEKMPKANHSAPNGDWPIDAPNSGRFKETKVIISRSGWEPARPIG